MFDYFLSATPLSIGDKLSIGGQVTILGMGTVFAVLILLWGLVEFLHLILGQKEPKKIKIPEKTTVVPTVAEPKNDTPLPTTSEQQTVLQDDLAIIAVITAAIAAASGQSPSSFRVVSFKRANNKFSFNK